MYPAGAFFTQPVALDDLPVTTLGMRMLQVSQWECNGVRASAPVSTPSIMPLACFHPGGQGSILKTAPTFSRGLADQENLIPALST
jgi:hypothetical protein